MAELWLKLQGDRCIKVIRACYIRTPSLPSLPKPCVAPGGEMPPFLFFFLPLSQFIVIRICQHSQFGSGSFHFVRKGCWFLPNMEKSLQSLQVGEGAPFMLNITILIALMPFLEGEGIACPTQQSTKMFNHCRESNQILSFLKQI